MRRSGAPLLSPKRDARLAAADAGHRDSKAIRSRQPVGSYHVALEVVPGAIAAHEAAGDFNWRFIGREGHAIDLKRQGARRLAEQLCFPGPQAHRLDRFPGTDNTRLVTLAQDVVERPMLEIEGEQPREALCRQGSRSLPEE